MNLNLDPKSSAIVIIDMQEKFIEGISLEDTIIVDQYGGQFILGSENLIQNHIELLNKNPNIPVYNFLLKPEEYGDLNSRIKEVLDRRDDVTYFEKVHNDAFDDGRLAVDLTARGIDKLLITGLDLPVCVADTVTSGNKLGFKTYTNPSLMSQEIGYYLANQGYVNRKSRYLKLINAFTDFL